MLTLAWTPWPSKDQYNLTHTHTHTHAYAHTDLLTFMHTHMHWPRENDLSTLAWLLQSAAHLLSDLSLVLIGGRLIFPQHFISEDIEASRTRWSHEPLLHVGAQICTGRGDYRVSFLLNVLFEGGCMNQKGRRHLLFRCSTMSCTTTVRSVSFLVAEFG